MKDAVILSLKEPVLRNKVERNLAGDLKVPCLSSQSFPATTARLHEALLGILNLSTSDIRDQVSLHGGDCMHCRTLSNFPGLYTPHASSCSPSCDNSKCLQTSPSVLVEWLQIPLSFF